VFEGKDVKSISIGAEDTDRMSRLAELRNKMEKFRRLSIPANERGFTGGTPNGKSVGPPESVNDSKTNLHPISCIAAK
jgi:hypothetical protein